jgi:hypothetical protein
VSAFGMGSNEHDENLIPFASIVSLKLKGTPQGEKYDHRPSGHSILGEHKS